MRLELGWSDVDHLTAASATRLAGRRLEVELDTLRRRTGGILKATMIGEPPTTTATIW